MHKQAFRAYQTTQKSTMSERHMEELAFMRAVGFLRQAKEDLTNFDLYSRALRFNQKLWLYVQTSVLDSASPLSGNLKINILNLGMFIDRHTIKSLMEPKTEKLDVLIDINVNIARALSEGSRTPKVH